MAAEPCVSDSAMVDARVASVASRVPGSVVAAAWTSGDAETVGGPNVAWSHAICSGVKGLAIAKEGTKQNRVSVS